MERDSARGAIQPGMKILARFGQTGLGLSARAELRPGLKISHEIETEFQPGLKSGKQYGFSADKVKQYEAVRKAMNSANLKMSSLSLQIRLSG